MSGMDFFRKVGNIAQTVGKLVSPGEGPGPKQPYRVVITLDVVAHNKRELEHAIKSAREKLNRLGYDLVGQAIGISGSVRCTGLNIEIEKSARAEKEE